jgi:hypothetical protein
MPASSGSGFQATVSYSYLRGLAAPEVFVGAARSCVGYDGF